MQGNIPKNKLKEGEWSLEILEINPKYNQFNSPLIMFNHNKLKRP